MFLGDVFMCDLNFLLSIFRVSKVALICTYVFIVRMQLLYQQKYLPAGVFYLGHLPNGGEVGRMPGQPPP